MPRRLFRVWLLLALFTAVSAVLDVQQLGWTPQSVAVVTRLVLVAALLYMLVREISRHR